jgi:thymidylate synthase
MALNFIASTFDEVQDVLLENLVYSPEHESRPRGQLVREDLCVGFELTNPRARLTSSPARAANYGFAAGEFLWYLRGSRDLESITYYNKRMPAFSDDGKTVNSAYGALVGIAQPQDEATSQWARVVDELCVDPDSRRAVMTVFAPSHLPAVATGASTKDVPCTLSLQFLIRERKLHLHVSMRSNDVVWGLCNDIFSFTLMQEVMLLDLRARGFEDLALGSYHHTAGSMHLYERHFDLAQQILDEDVVAAPPMPPLTSRASLDALLASERALRRNAYDVYFDIFRAGSGEAWLLEQLKQHRRRRDAEQTKEGK